VSSLNNKQELREKILAKRKSFDSVLVEESSRIISNYLINSDLFSQSKVIMTYLNYPKEVQTDYIFQAAIKQNKTVTIPVCVKESTDLIPSKITDLNQLAIGYYGLREPKKEYLNPVDPKLIDLIIVPGVAFDLKGNRIGHGKGYYDTFFKKISTSAIKIGLAYQFQIIEDSWNADSWDVPLDGLITENGFIYLKKIQ